MIREDHEYLHLFLDAIKDQKVSQRLLEAASEPYISI